MIGCVGDAIFRVTPGHLDAYRHGLFYEQPR